LCLSDIRGLIDDKQILWEAVTCLLSSIAIIAVSEPNASLIIATDPSIQTLTSIYRRGRSTSSAFVADNALNLEALSLRRFFGREAAISLGRLRDDYLCIALRISSYPIVLIIPNGLFTGKYH